MTDGDPDPESEDGDLPRGLAGVAAGRSMEVVGPGRGGDAADAAAHLDELRVRYARDARLHAELVDRLRGDLRAAQARAADLESLQADSLRLGRMAALLDGRLSAAVQSCGLDTLRRSLAGQVEAWTAEVERDRADLLLRIAAEGAQRHAVLGSTSWRMTGPLRRLGRASRAALRQPHRVPVLLARGLRRGARAAPADAAAAPVPGPERPFDGLAAAAARVDGELALVSELLQRLAAVADGRDRGGHPSAPPPGSDAYRALPHAGRLAAWIRHAAARGRDPAP